MPISNHALQVLMTFKKLLEIGSLLWILQHSLNVIKTDALSALISVYVILFKGFSIGQSLP